MKYRYIFLFYVSLMLFGCSRVNQDKSLEPETIRFDVAGWETGKMIPEDVIKRIKFIPLETSSQCLLRGIGKIMPFENKWYISDSNFPTKIFVFDKQGNYLYGIGNYGRGPGEFGRLTDFTINKTEKQLYILDSNLRKILIYDISNGNHFKDIPINFWATNISCLNDGLVSLFSQNYSVKSIEGYSISYLNLHTGAIRHYLAKNEYDVNISTGHSLFESENIYYAPYLKDTIYKISMQGVLPAVTFNFGNYKIPENHLQAARKNEDFSLLAIHKEGKWTYCINNVIENSQFMSFSIRNKGHSTLMIRSKVTGNYVYGEGFDGLLGTHGLVSRYNIASDENFFLGYFDAFIFKRLIKEYKKGTFTSELYDMPNLDQVHVSSNPVVVCIEYNEF